jgi:hypothetical protein
MCSLTLYSEVVKRAFSGAFRREEVKISIWEETTVG